MIVSWNELQRTCQKAFRALGVPAGADDDGSFAVLWLQARGLDALMPLSAALDALERAPPHPLGVVRCEDKGGVLDAGGQPALSIASDALDLAVACAVEREACAEVPITGLGDGIFVAGVLALRPISGCCGRVEWDDGGSLRRLDMASNGACRLSVKPPDETECNGGLGREAVRIVIDGSGRRQWMERSRYWRTDANEAELERRAMHSVTHGVDVPDALWTRLLAFAKRTLVPATHASRERGAGGGEYND